MRSRNVMRGILAAGMIVSVRFTPDPLNAKFAFGTSVGLDELDMMAVTAQ